MHKSVLLNETVELLAPEAGKNYVDMTLGAGGHSLEIIERLQKAHSKAKNEVSTLIAFDSDKSAIENFEKVLKNLGFKKQDRFMVSNNVKVLLVNDNFSTIEFVIESLSKDSEFKVNGMIADLGWSSDQLESIAGLSYHNEFDDLDMRLSQATAVKAADLLNALSKKELKKMFESYADIYGKQNEDLVLGIIAARKHKLIETVGELLKIIDSKMHFSKGNRFQNNKKEKTYSKVFQALRIAVNSEYTSLKTMLESSTKLITEGTKLLVITFHSGEEKIVMEFAKKSKLKISEAVRPSVEELKENIRSRSAKLFEIRY